MELATVALATLLPKLDELGSEEYMKQKSVRDDLKVVRHEMASMHAALAKLAEAPTGQIEQMTRIWADDVREVSYATEDSIDRFMLYMANNSVAGPSSMKRARELLKKLKARQKVGVIIQELKNQVQALTERYGPYGGAAPSPSTKMLIDPRISYQYTDGGNLVGVHEASEELIKRLPSDGGKKQQPLKILSIVGLPGVGKTTLANAVHDKMQTQFDCSALVLVGRNPDVKNVFRDILLHIDRENYLRFMATSTNIDVQKYIQEIQEQLTDKRYLIVVDDICDTNSWEIIRWAFTDCNSGSIVITTTRIYEVAVRAGGVYKLEPLSPHNSEELLHMCLLGHEGTFPIKQATQPIQKVLQKCGGIPLAIITVASLLSGKPEDSWHEVSDSNFWAADDRAVETARMLVLLSYYDLPKHLKVCLLHLSIFPKNYMVRKDTLIWKWVAEGFIPENPTAGLFEMGEVCFNELINRNMIQPVEISHNGDVIGCRVHDMVHDIICSMAKENNFLCLLNGNEQHTYLKNNARRFALHGKVVEEQYSLAGTDMSIVRSFNAIRCDTSMMPSLSSLSFELLRVLAIEDCSSSQLEGNAYSLEHIGMLLLLRYLGLSKSPVSMLPKDVGNLKFLEILDVRQTGIRELPKSVRLLSRLKCLRADGGSTRVPDWIGNLTSLEELSVSDVSSCPNFVKEVSKLTMLRELKIWIRVLDGRSKYALMKSLSNLQKIQVFHLNGGLLIEEAEWEGYVPPRQLRRLSLRIKSVRLPRWMNNSLLPAITHLSVDLRVVEADDLEILGSFPGLISLELFIPNRVSLDIKGCDAFPKLRHCYSSGMLRFLEGAAPLLESVHFNVMSDLNGATFQCDSLENLRLLKEVRVEIFYSVARVAVEVEKELWRAVHDHVNHPTLHVSKYEIVL